MSRVLVGPILQSSTRYDVCFGRDVKMVGAQFSMESRAVGELNIWILLIDFGLKQRILFNYSQLISEQNDWRECAHFSQAHIIIAFAIHQKKKNTNDPLIIVFSDVVDLRPTAVIGSCNMSCVFHFKCAAKCKCVSRKFQNDEKKASQGLSLTLYEY